MAIEQVFTKESQIIYIYIAKETIDDPFENNVTVVLLPPIPIEAIVSAVPFEKIQWALPGITTNKAKILIIERQHLQLIKISNKIKIDNEYYYGKNQDSSELFNFDELDDDYIKLYVAKKEI